MPRAIELPLPVVEAHRAGKLALLCGSGISLGVPGRFPRWDELPERLLQQAARLEVWTPGQIEAKRAFFKAGHVTLEGMLAELDTLKVALGGPRKYRAALSALFRPHDGAPGDVHRAIAELEARVVLTTNYDLLLEAVEGAPIRMVYTWRDSDNALEDIQDGRKVLFKIHGTAEDDDSIIMTRGEYERAVANESYPRIMSHLWQTYTFLLVGYGINDPLDLDLVFGLNARAFGAASRTHYSLMRDDVRASDRDRWLRELNVQVIPYSDYSEIPSILRTLSPAVIRPPDPR